MELLFSVKKLLHPAVELLNPVMELLNPVKKWLFSARFPSKTTRKTHVNL